MLTRSGWRENKKRAEQSNSSLLPPLHSNPASKPHIAVRQLESTYRTCSLDHHLRYSHHCIASPCSGRSTAHCFVSQLLTDQSYVLTSNAHSAGVESYRTLILSG